MSCNALFSAIFALFLSANTFGQQTINASMMHGGIQRDYILYIPANYTGTDAVPILLNFHGYTSNAAQQFFYSNFPPIADTAGFIIVLPEGTLDGTGATHFNVGWGGSSVDDVSFTSALLDTVAASYNVDQNRIYSTGMSNGGFMSFKLACELSGRIAAIGSVTGSMTLGSTIPCNATHPTPILQIHGTSDATVAYNGSNFSESVPNVLDYWINFNNSGVSSTTTMPNVSTTDGSTVEKISSVGGDACAEVVHYKVIGGSHTWPGAPIDLGGTNYDINASVLVWNFVSQYDINGFIGNCTANVNDVDPQLAITVYPNPTNSVVKVNGLSQETTFELISVLGERVLTGKANPTSNSIDVANLTKGMYFLKIDGSVLEVIVE